MSLQEREKKNQKPIKTPKSTQNCIKLWDGCLISRVLPFSGYLHFLFHCKKSYQAHRYGINTVQRGKKARHIINILVTYYWKAKHKPDFVLNATGTVWRWRQQCNYAIKERKIYVPEWKHHIQQDKGFNMCSSSPPGLYITQCIGAHIWRQGIQKVLKITS